MTSTTSSSSSVKHPTSTCLKQALMEAASTIFKVKSKMVVEILNRPEELMNSDGNSEQRLMDCAIYTLKSKVNGQNLFSVGELFSYEHAESTQLLYEHSPCFKVGSTDADLAILEAAFEENTGNDAINKLHFVDFEIRSIKRRTGNLKWRCFLFEF